jgi:type IV pilus assembly protein PilB
METTNVNTENVPVSARPVASDAADIIGELLAKSNVITQDQLKYARRVQQKLATPRTLISVLQELRLVTPEQVQEAMKANRVSVPLGALLVELGYIRESDLKIALALQQQNPGSRLGAIIVENHLVEESDLVDVLSMQLGFERLDPVGATLDPELMNLAPARWFRGNDLLPLGKRDGRVVVALADPLNPKYVETAKRVFGEDIVIGIARRCEIHEVLDRFEGAKTVTNASAIDNIIVQTVNQIIADAVEGNASDIHIEPIRDRIRIRLRHDGVLVNYKELSPDLVAPFTSRIKILAKADIAEKRRHQDGRIFYDYKGITLDIRVSTYVTIHGEAIVMRLLNNRSQLLDVNELGMAPRILQHYSEDALDAPSGIVIVTGPTGSGKTTTLYASINHLNNPQTSIITAEDPVEYVIEGITQCSINPKINVTYEDTLKHIVRQDPDVIVIGEIRDLFSAETAIQAALTGHKVLTTFHTEDSIGGLLRLLNMNIEAFLISSTVVSVIAQRLVRRLCPHCAEDAPLTPQQVRRLGYEPRDLAGTGMKVPRGCSRCRFSGYSGRMAIFELLVLNEHVKDALIARKTSYEIRRIGTESTGLVTLLEDSIHKALQGLTSFEEIIRQIPRLSKPRPISEVRRLLGD